MIEWDSGEHAWQAIRQGVNSHSVTNFSKLLNFHNAKCWNKFDWPKDFSIQEKWHRKLNLPFEVFVQPKTIILCSVYVQVSMEGKRLLSTAQSVLHQLPRYNWLFGQNFTMQTLQLGQLEENWPIRMFLENERCFRAFSKQAEIKLKCLDNTLQQNLKPLELADLSANCSIFYWLVAILHFELFETIWLSQ